MSPPDRDRPEDRGAHQAKSRENRHGGQSGAAQYPMRVPHRSGRHSRRDCNDADNSCNTESGGAQISDQAVSAEFAKREMYRQPDRQHGAVACEDTLKQSFENGFAVIGTIQQYKAEQKGERTTTGRGARAKPTAARFNDITRPLTDSFHLGGAMPVCRSEATKAAALDCTQNFLKFQSGGNQ